MLKFHSLHSLSYLRHVSICLDQAQGFTLRFQKSIFAYQVEKLLTNLLRIYVAIATQFKQQYALQ